MKVDVKVLADNKELCYNIEWPCELTIEKCFNVTDLYVNNFKINDINSICTKQGPDIVIKFDCVDPMRWMLKIKNEYQFNRVNIQ